MKAVLKDSELLIGKAVGQTFHRENKTESYVCVPPALIITDSNGATWTLGRDYVQKGLRYYWSVLRNDEPVGEYTEVIEYRKGKVYIYPPTGRPKVWTEKGQGDRPGYMI